MVTYSSMTKKGEKTGGEFIKVVHLLIFVLGIPGGTLLLLTPFWPLGIMLFLAAIGVIIVRWRDIKNAEGGSYRGYNPSTRSSYSSGRSGSSSSSSGFSGHSGGSSGGGGGGARW